MTKRISPKQFSSILMAVSLLSFTLPVISAEKQTNPQDSAMMQKTENYAIPYSSVVPGQTHVIPSGTGLKIHPVGIIPEQAGETFTGQIISPVVVNGVTAIPAGSQIKGNVVGINQNVMDIQFREVSTTSGEVIPIRSSVTIPRIQGGVEVQREGYRSSTLYPHVSIGPRALSPGGKVVAGTLGGAVFGGATGTLTGLTMASDSDISSGSGAARGLGWGAAYGAGLGLLSGAIAAMADRNRTSVTTVSKKEPSRYQSMTNITTGSLQEIPVAYTTMEGVVPDFAIILEQPVSVTR